MSHTAYAWDEDGPSQLPHLYWKPGYSASRDPPHLECEPMSATVDWLRRLGLRATSADSFLFEDVVKHMY